MLQNVSGHHDKVGSKHGESIKITLSTVWRFVDENVTQYAAAYPCQHPHQRRHYWIKFGGKRFLVPATTVQMTIAGARHDLNGGRFDLTGMVAESSKI